MNKMKNKIFNDYTIINKKKNPTEVLLKLRAADLYKDGLEIIEENSRGDIDTKAIIYSHYGIVILDTYKSDSYEVRIASEVKDNRNIIKSKLEEFCDIKLEELGKK
jgi:hypothetical protein